MEGCSRLRGEDFSVVVQGPIHGSPGRRGSRDLTIRCLESIRRFLPGAEIVLSTWQDADTDGLDFDLLVKSGDPGAVPYNDTDTPPASNNINRQIVSTRAGLAIARRPCAIKFRGDLFFESDALLDCGGVLSEMLPHGYFRRRVIITPYHTRNPRRVPFLFNFSDIVQIGGMDDLREFWSAPLAPEPQTTRWLEGRPRLLFAPLKKYYYRVNPEQYLVLEWLAVHGRRIELDHPWDISIAKALLSERVLVNNFQLADPAQLGVRFPERILLAVPSAHLYHVDDGARLARAYRRPLSRWRAQAGLLAGLYWRFFEFVLNRFVTYTPLQHFPPYRWGRSGYRYFFPRD